MISHFLMKSTPRKMYPLVSDSSDFVGCALSGQVLGIPLRTCLVIMPVYSNLKTLNARNVGFAGERNKNWA